MIEKMRFVSITGPKEDFDRMIEAYLSKYEVHLENALSELKTVQNLRPFIEKNPYKDKLLQLDNYVNQLEDYAQQAGNSADDSLSKEKQQKNRHSKGVAVAESMSSEKAMELAESLHQKMMEQEAKKDRLRKELQDVTALRSHLEPFKEVDVDLQRLKQFRFIHVRFGKIVTEHYRRLEHYMLEDCNSIFYKCSSNAEYVWGVYFVPEMLSDKVDAMYASMHFERIVLPDEYEGTPMKAYLQLTEKCRKLEQEMEENQRDIVKVLKGYEKDLVVARDKLQTVSDSFDIRKMAACFQEEESVFYILCGWMAQRDAKSLEEELEGEPNVFIMEEDAEEAVFQEPPTKLRNPKLLKPFEMFTKMYGMPAYNEMDPTIFIAITYTFIFGAMFGDVGQGLVLVLGGALLYKFKKMNLAAIISCAGVFSTIFGVLFGSVFGFENLIPALWLHPKSSTVAVPVVGELNTVFVVAIGFGMGLILLTMVFHIINAAKEKNWESLFFDTNGVAGLVFYGALVLVVALMMTGKSMPATLVLVVMFVVPLLLIALKEPLGRLIERKAEIMPNEKGMFVVQTFFELFEVLLSYFSNTLSFIRVGAFAVSHAAMMEVVLTLAGAESGATNWVVIVIGNIVVCGLEGLIVGIQVLRLEYYEMFSRFYKGSGREFENKI